MPTNGWPYVIGALGRALCRMSECVESTASICKPVLLIRVPYPMTETVLSDTRENRFSESSAAMRCWCTIPYPIPPRIVEVLLLALVADVARVVPDAMCRTNMMK